MKTIQINHFLEQATFVKIIHEYASDRRAAPMALIVTRGDDLIETVDRYGVDAARKLTKWGMLEVDLRVKRKDVVGYLSPVHVACLCYDIQPEIALNVAERLRAGILEDQPDADAAERFAFPMKQESFDYYLNQPDENGNTEIIDGSNQRLQWEHHKPQPAAYWTSFSYDTKPPADLKRRLRLLDKRITLSVGVAQKRTGEPAGEWIARAIANTDRACESGGNRVESSTQGAGHP